MLLLLLLLLRYGCSKVVIVVAESTYVIHSLPLGSPSSPHAHYRRVRVRHRDAYRQYDHKHGSDRRIYDRHTQGIRDHDVVPFEPQTSLLYIFIEQFCAVVFIAGGLEGGMFA